MLNLESIKSKKSISEILKFSIINIDKPSGPTSFQVSQYVKTLLGANKTSHFGTLDPAVSGVLPVALGRACRLSDYFMHRDKTYVGIMRLHANISDKQLNEVIQNFLGTIQQLPPVRSRVKRAVRAREVKSFKILERNGKDILFETQVQAGTYIRKLCDDMGKEIGGAHMLELRRTQAGIFEEKDSITLYQLEATAQEYQKGNEQPLRKLLIPGEVVGTILPVISLKPDVLPQCLRGAPLFTRFILHDISSFEKGEKIAAFEGERFIGCYRVINEGEVKAVPEFVFN